MLLNQNYERLRGRDALINFQTDIVAGNDDLVRPDVFDGRRSHHLASSEVKLGSMPRTNYTSIDDRAFAEASAIVRANVVDGVNGSIHVEQSN